MSTSVIDIQELLGVDPTIWGGRPHLKGTRVTVHTIAARHLRGDTVDDIAASFPHASRAAIYAALSYYYAHRAEIDAELESDAQSAEMAADRQGH